MVALLAQGCGGGTAAAPPPGGPSIETYRVGAPDQLRIVVLPDPAIERQVNVRPDGMISIDLIGDVPAEGRTVEEIAADVQQRISRYKRDARVTVELANPLSTEITILGEAFGRSAFPLVKQTRVAEAIAMVGGPTSFAQTRKIRVIRYQAGETVIYNVDLEAIYRGDLRTNMVLASGDIIYLPPTIMARIGYVIQQLLFPLQPLMGIGYSIAGNIITGTP